MNYEELKQAIDNGTPLVWNDPLPIEGNDYSISSITLPELEEGMKEDDLIILIQYSNGYSEAEVLLHEIDIDIQKIIDQDELVEAYPVDESQTVSNAGDARVYRWGNLLYQVITWNERADDHVAGSITYGLIE